MTLVHVQAHVFLTANYSLSIVTEVLNNEFIWTNSVRITINDNIPYNPHAHTHRERERERERELIHIIRVF